MLTVASREITKNLKAMVKSFNNELVVVGGSWENPE